MAAGLLLAGCGANRPLNDLTATPSAGEASSAVGNVNSAPSFAAETAAPVAAADPAAAASTVPPPLGAPAAAEPQLYGSDPNDDLSRGKKQYRAGNYGLAEKYFRHAVELHPRDAESWLGLAATYDRLRRFDLADRAYAQAIRIVGPTVEILNNQGYSYMLRGDYARAHATLLAAQRKAPDNPYIENNLRLLAESERTGKAVK
ncbi:MAG: tetratricopeptide repeat protein [Pseudolabrys sp.]|nr:tetratricopeptide repeat protein [Pseudolabrys sp.]